MYKYRVVPGEPIPLGRRYEHLARRIIFDITEWVEIFGSGIVELLHQRQGDAIPYPVTVLRTDADMETPNHTSGVLVLWDVTNVDTEKKCQYGTAELRYYATGGEERLVKSELYRTIVVNAMGSEISDAPERQPEWLATLLDATDTIDDNLTAAQSAATDAAAAVTAAQAAQSDAADAANTATAAALAARAAQSEAEAALSNISVSVTGDGNAVTGLSYDAETNEFTAAKAATFLTEHQSLSNYATKAELPTKTSDLTNDAGFLTSHQSLADYATKAELPTKTSDLSNDSGFITKAVNDLTNYYLKSETYTKSEINALISAIPKLDIQVVSSLPASDISTETIYLVTTGNESQNLYTEYIYANNAWEKLGTQTLDLSGYVQETRTVAGHSLSADVIISKSDVGLGNVDNTSDADKPISTATQTALNGKVDKDGAKVLSDNNYTTAEKNKLAGIPADATNNAGTITGITMNGASKGTSGVVDLGTVLTSHQDISGKVDKVTGKGLSTNDFTDAYKTKLDSALTQHQDISGKVDKVIGKGLSTEDYTTEEKNKLSGVETQANKTTIDATLSHTGQAADAKAAGDEIAALQSENALLRELIEGIDADVYRTKSGNPVTFADAKAANLKAMAVTITPTQSGSGDPYPPGAGKNLLDVSAFASTNNVAVTSYSISDGAFSLMALNTASEYGNVVYTTALKQGTYILSGTLSSSASGAVPRILVLNSNTGNTIGAISNETSTYSFTVSYDITAIIVARLNQLQTISAGDTFTAFNVMLRRSDTDPTFAPYSNVRPISGVSSVTVTRAATDGANSQSVTVPLADSNSDPLTVYGGTLDVTTGTLTMTHIMVDADTATWNSSGSGDNMYLYASLERVSPALAAPVSGFGSPFLSSHFVPGNVNSSNFAVGFNVTWMSQTIPTLIIVKPAQGGFSTLQDFTGFLTAQRAAGTPVQFVFPLATPVTYQLTPQQLAALAGYNSVSTDAGTLDVTYKADTAITFGGGT